MLMSVLKVLTLNLVGQLVHRAREFVEAVDEAPERPDRAFRLARVLGDCCKKYHKFLSSCFRSKTWNPFINGQLSILASKINLFSYF